MTHDGEACHVDCRGLRQVIHTIDNPLSVVTTVKSDVGIYNKKPSTTYAFRYQGVSLSETSCFLGVGIASVLDVASSVQGTSAGVNGGLRLVTRLIALGQGYFTRVRFRGIFSEHTE